MFLDPGAQGWIATAGIGSVALVNIVWTVRTGSLWPAFITHGTFNGVQILMVSAPIIFGNG
jgi:membrane protease YdiL (CAAX protease family)